jgi:hypothetical protein
MYHFNNKKYYDKALAEESIDSKLDAHFKANPELAEESKSLEEKIEDAEYKLAKAKRNGSEDEIFECEERLAELVEGDEDLSEEGIKDAFSAFKKAFNDKTAQGITQGFVTRLNKLKTVLEDATDVDISVMAEKELTLGLSDTQYKVFVKVLLGTKGEMLAKDPAFVRYAKLYLGNLLEPSQLKMAPYIFLKYLILEGFMGDRALDLGYKKLMKSIKSGNMKARITDIADRVRQEQEAAERAKDGTSAIAAEEIAAGGL